MTSKTWRRAPIRRYALAFLLIGAASATMVRLSNGHARPSTLVIERLAARQPGRLTVGSTAIGANGHFAARNTGFAADLSPEVNWTAAPGARAWAVILEDPDAPGPTPFVHWLVWNIGGGESRLMEGVVPAGAQQGRNGFGKVGYSGPRPPSGTHRYHLEVFALAAPLALSAGADRQALEKAMRGQVIASGEVVGLAAAPR